MSNQNEEVLNNEELDSGVNEDESIKAKEVEIKEEGDEILPKEKVNSHEELIKKVELTKELAQNKYQEYLQINQELEKTTQEFIELENKILDSTVEESLELLKRLGIDSLNKEDNLISEIKQDNKEELIKIKKPSKGIVKGVFFGLLSAIATSGIAIIYGAKISNLPLNSATFLQKSNLDTIASKIAELLHLEGPIAGYSVIGVSSLAIGFIVYKIVRSIQKSRNIKYVQKIEQTTQEYIDSLDDKISRIEELIEHIKNIESVMLKYDVILQEQNAKIRRILFIEKPEEEGIDSLQKASRLEVEKTQLLLDELLKLMNTPVNDELNITKDSIEMLHNANTLINEVIKKLYVVN